MIRRSYAKPVMVMGVQVDDPFHRRSPQRDLVVPPPVEKSEGKAATRRRNQMARQAAKKLDRQIASVLIDWRERGFLHIMPRCEHVWDGPACEPDGPGSYAVTCSKCGLDNMTHSLRTGI